MAVLFNSTYIWAPRQKKYVMATCLASKVETEAMLVQSE